MASKAQLLPSGAYRSLGCVYINGTRKTKSFTVNPEDVGGATKAKKECVRRAEDWEDEYNDISPDKVTVLMALDKYMSDRENVLSPSTIRSYDQMKQYFTSIYDCDALELCTDDIQPLVNEMAISYTGKTIKNRISYLLSALEYAGNDRKFKIRYPQIIKPKTQSPEHDEVKRLLAEADGELKIAMCLAAFSTLRRSEICGLQYKDILRDLSRVYVHQSCVVGKDRKFHYKEMPKNVGSIRTIDVPKELIKLIPEGNPENRVITMTPAMLTKRFCALRDRLHIDCRFHDLRHYAATFRSEIGIPDKYIEEAGGWTNDSKVMNEVYNNRLDSSRKLYSQQANDYISDNFHDVI